MPADGPQQDTVHCTAYLHVQEHGCAGLFSSLKGTPGLQGGPAGSQGVHLARRDRKAELTQRFGANNHRPIKYEGAGTSNAVQLLPFAVTGQHVLRVHNSAPYLVMSFKVRMQPGRQCAKALRGVLPSN